MSSGVVKNNTALPLTGNELLCFIHEKCKVILADDLSKICSAFYGEEEIFADKVLIELVNSCQQLTYHLPK